MHHEHHRCAWFLEWMQSCFGHCATKRYLHNNQAFSVWHSAPSANRLEVGKSLGGDTTQTGDLNCPKGYSICLILCLEIKTKEEGFGREESHCSETVWAPVYFWEAVSDCLCITCIGCWFVVFFSFLYYNPRVFSLLFFVFSPPSHYKGPRANSCVGLSCWLVSTHNA